MEANCSILHSTASLVGLRFIEDLRKSLIWNA
jgi:hypothetical protein